jgi:type I restriction enzyme M protein
MMNQEIRRRIDNARQVLVGKVPDPKSQVEQITTALIYKFMDDMDTESVRLEGNPGFFVNDYEKYSWTKLMNSRLGGQNRLNLYAEAVMNLSQNPHLPQLFRDIFKDAFLPYRDPETLNLFLKEIDGFSYGSTDNLGDAYEYLLSVLGSQGNAGQFLTPRHIIKFIVSIVDPKKNETILDPACGTAGFLILAYLHILEANTEKKPGDLLTPDEKDKLIHNFVGYDIDPGMRRLSLVNMYLHNFSSPHIYEYDTLTNDEKWQDQFDVIMANPPFMSPKGGIRPHKRFAIHANRSEVLFVDYIAEHLNINGRAGVIVPEGIIFQSANAYKSLRKMLIDDYLWAVVSLPAGVFHPYSGVKTSILFMDKKLAKQTDKILFVKIENDGFDLGAQRREIDKNDLPLATDVMNFYKNNIRENKNLELPEGYLKIANVIPKQKIINLGDYNLTGDRYKEVVNFANQKWPMVELGECVDLYRGVVYSKKDEVSKDGFKILRANNISLDGNLVLEDIKLISKDLKLKESQKLKAGDIFICLASGSKDHIGKVAFIKEDTDYFFGGFMGAIRVKSKIVDPLYIFYLLKDQKFNNYLGDVITGANINNLNSGILSRYEIPLPPLEVQKEIVQEIEGYQKIIDGARQVVKNWKPTIKIDPEWPMVELGEICEFINGLWKGKKPPFKKIKVIRNTNFSKDGKLNLDDVAELDVEVSQLEKRTLQNGDIILEKSGGGPTQPIGRVVLFNLDENNYSFSNFTSSIRMKDKTKLFSFFLWAYLNNLYQDGYTENLQKQTSGIRNLDFTAYKSIQIPLPPLEVQKQIVSQIEEEQKAVDACKKLIEINEQKIKSKISEVWGEE